MAWLWKQGRPTLLTLVGLGFLEYTATQRSTRNVSRWGKGRQVRACGERPRRTRH